MRRPLIAGNWKMFKTLDAAVPFVEELKEKLKEIADRDILLVPPYPFLEPIRQVTRGSNLLLGAQNLFWEDEGAFTGEVSPLMLKGVGCSHVLIGHSERRQYFNETDETVNKKVKAALKHGLFPVVCIGETLEEREGEKTFDVLDAQIKSGLRDLNASDMQRIIIAYEPVWAIGTGKTATPELAEEVHSHIRENIEERGVSTMVWSNSCSPWWRHTRMICCSARFLMRSLCHQKVTSAAIKVDQNKNSIDKRALHFSGCY